MAIFSTNQVRQLYVAKALKTTPVVGTDPEGTISVHKNTDGDLYFKYKGADTTLTSDLININTLRKCKATDADNLKTPLKRTEVALNPAINSGNPIAGQDYILRIHFKQWIGLSMEDQYFKYGQVFVTQGMTAAEFYKELKKSLELNFSKYVEVGKVLSFELDSDSAPTKLIIQEEPQEWELGLKQQMPLVYEIQPVTVNNAGIEVFWANITNVAPTKFIDNGHTIADMEYFYMGERGDIYRNVGFPRVIKTKYMVDPSGKYNTIDIPFYFEGQGEQVQKSEKALILVVPKVGATNSISNKLANDIIGAINTAVGTNILSTLATS